MGSSLAQPTGRTEAPAEAPGGTRFPSRRMSKRAFGSSSSMTSAPCVRAAPVCSRWMATSVTLIGRGEEARRGKAEEVRHHSRRPLHVALLGHGYPQGRAQANKDTIVVVMTGNPSVSSSIEALRAGAWDYLPSRSRRLTSRC